MHLGGNIGHPLFSDVPDMAPNDYAVLELSSFQLHSMKCRPDVAVITNVSPNHLDKHPDYQDYVDAKSFIFTGQTEDDRLVLNRTDEQTEYYAVKARSRLSLFSRGMAVLNGVFSDGTSVYYARNGKMEKILDCAEIKLPGSHNLENYMAAFAATDGLVAPYLPQGRYDFRRGRAQTGVCARTQGCDLHQRFNRHKPDPYGSGPSRHENKAHSHCRRLRQAHPI